MHSERPVPIALGMDVLSRISFPVENQAAWVRAIGLARGFVQIGEMGATLAEAWRSWGALWLQTLVYGLAAAYLMGPQRRTAGALAPAEDFRRDSDLFGEGASPEVQSRFGAGLKRGFQTRGAEMDLARLLGDLTDG